MASLEIRTSEELIDPALEKRWTARRDKRQADVLQRILRTFVERGGPVTVSGLAAAFPDRPPAAVRQTVVALDEEDLIQVTDDEVVIAYPFSASPTAFAVRLADGGDRYACCAIDALGIAPMLRQGVQIRSECHHCGLTLTFSAEPDGPAPDANGIMVWVEKRPDDQRRVSVCL